MYVRVEYSDGNYWLEPFTPKHAELKMPAIEIADEEWDCYQAFTKHAQLWHDRCRDLGNRQYDLENPPEETADVCGDCGVGAGEHDDLCPRLNIGMEKL
jgi:hypothetical protein